jgi:hypothetical protein
MLEHPDRVEQFKTEIAEMHLPDPASGRDRLLLRGGVVLMVAGVIVTIVAYSMSHGTTNVLTQNDAQVVGMIGIAVTVLGGALFLRYSIAHFLRFWLARLSWEQAAQTDRLVEALGSGTASTTRTNEPAA